LILTGAECPFAFGGPACLGTSHAELPWRNRPDGGAGGSLFGLRYGLTGRLDLQPPLAHNPLQYLRQPFVYRNGWISRQTSRR